LIQELFIDTSYSLPSVFFVSIEELGTVLCNSATSFSDTTEPSFRNAIGLVVGENECILMEDKAEIDDGSGDDDSTAEGLDPVFTAFQGVSDPNITLATVCPLFEYKTSFRLELAFANKTVSFQLACKDSLLAAPAYSASVSALSTGLENILLSGSISEDSSYLPISASCLEKISKKLNLSLTFEKVDIAPPQQHALVGAHSTIVLDRSQLKDDASGLLNPSSKELMLVFKGNCPSFGSLKLAATQFRCVSRLHVKEIKLNESSKSNFVELLRACEHSDFPVHWDPDTKPEKGLVLEEVCFTSAPVF
jgi:hypothetical protein